MITAFSPFPPASWRFADLSITNGRGDVGGGIYSQADLTLEEVSVTSNTSTAGQGGGIYNAGTLVVSFSIISANTSKGPDAGYGGGIYNTEFGQATINSSNVTGNVATSSTMRSSVYGGGIYNDGVLTINDGAVFENRAVTACSSVVPGFVAAGGGIYNNAGILEIFASLDDPSNLAEANRNSSARTGTISGFGGGIYNSGVGEADHRLQHDHRQHRARRDAIRLDSRDRGRRRHLQRWNPRHQ